MPSPNRGPRPGVIFDLDGTLVDTTYLHVLAWSRSLHDAGEQAAMASIHRLIGMSSERVTADLVGRPDDQVSEGHGRHFRRLLDDVRASRGAAELLSEVHRLGAAVVVATSAKADDLDAMLAAVGAPEGVVDQVVHTAEVEESKPAPDLLEHAIDVGALDRARCVVVGDTVWDVEAATRCGLPCVAVLTGGTTKAELEEAGAVAVYRDPAELLEHLEESPLARALR
ncbi:MAG TPA: HAD family hydrolase [Acidimicrobiales bacterium]|nr:HAD family hydrolase [Acidimicrobiales bacterium]